MKQEEAKLVINGPVMQSRQEREDGARARRGAPIYMGRIESLERRVGVLTRAHEDWLTWRDEMQLGLLSHLGIERIVCADCGKEADAWRLGRDDRPTVVKDGVWICEDYFDAGKEMLCPVCVDRRASGLPKCKTHASTATSGYVDVDVDAVCKPSTRPLREMLEEGRDKHTLDRLMTFQPSSHGPIIATTEYRFGTDPAIRAKAAMVVLRVEGEKVAQIAITADGEQCILWCADMEIEWPEKG